MTQPKIDKEFQYFHIFAKAYIPEKYEECLEFITSKGYTAYSKAGVPNKGSILSNTEKFLTVGAYRYAAIIPVNNAKSEISKETLCRIIEFFDLPTKNEITDALMHTDALRQIQDK